jgi:hypothetical protein
MVGLVLSYCVYQWEGKLSFCEVLGEAFVHGVLVRLQVHIIVPNLKVDSD